MHPFIDIHQHVMYGIDDGPADLAEADRMIDAAAADGAAAIIATPHASPGIKAFDMDAYRTRLDALNEYCAKKAYALKVLGGSEVLYTESAVRHLQERRIPSMNGSRFVLVEWPPGVRREGLYASVRELSNAGFVPILAHVERYACLHRNIGFLANLKDDFDVRVQVNCESVINARQFWGSKRFVTALMDAHLVDYVASDAHNTESRRVNVPECRLRLTEQYGVAYADRLTYRNQLDLL